MRDEILESKDVQFFKVEEVQGTRPTLLKISGLAFKSAMSVKEITIKTDNSAVVVLVHLAMARPGTSGSFEYQLTVPDSAQEVRFGKTATLVWKRGSSTAIMPN